MAQLLKDFYSVYVVFKRAHLLTYPEQDEFNSNPHNVSLNFVLISHYPVVPKENFVIVTGSCHPYSL